MTLGVMVALLGGCGDTGGGKPAGAGGAGASGAWGAGTGGAGRGGGGGSGGGGPGGAGGAGAGGAGAGGAQGGWRTMFREDFESLALAPAPFSADPVPDDGPFSDGGAFFRGRGAMPPAAFRSSYPIGQGGWLTVESYTRGASTAPADLASVVADPAGGGKVLRIASPAHTDATVIRPTMPLPERYRVSLRVGHADFGDGQGMNGYTGGETAEPWLSDDATGENGFYWLAILDAMPRPHVNAWTLHHRKVCIDSDSNRDAWSEVWNGTAFVASGERPIFMIALDGASLGDELTGNPFLPYANGMVQPSGSVRAVDAYKPGTWYDVSIEKNAGHYTLTISGDFRHGGQKAYTARFDYAADCVFHYNQTAADVGRCASTATYPSVPGAPLWPAGVAYPDYFMLGDPHVNFYEGRVHYDDLTLEVWQD